MNLRNLKDKELLANTKQLVAQERKLLTQVLHHLKEVERRRLFSDLGHRSLFAYAVEELGYSEGQAGRRIQAMRLIKELPEVEQKIEQGSISLSNISQAQSYFREAKKADPEMELGVAEKLQVIEKLEYKSAREGQKLICELQPAATLPKERERQVSDDHVEVKFVVSQQLKLQLEKVRSLLGPKGQNLSFAELVEIMATTTIDTLEDKRFGKRRMASHRTNINNDQLPKVPGENLNEQNPQSPQNQDVEVIKEDPSTPTVGVKSDKLRRRRNNLTEQSPQNPEVEAIKEDPSTPTVGVKRDKLRRRRHIPSAVKHQIWLRDQGQCTNCGSQRNLNYDHIHPVALGGSSEADNLRLLCFSCNQRQSLKTFGICDYGK